MNLFWRISLTFYFTIGILGNYANEVNQTNQRAHILKLKSWRSDISRNFKKDIFAADFAEIHYPGYTENTKPLDNIFFTVNLPKKKKVTKTKSKSLNSNSIAKSSVKTQETSPKIYTGYTDYLAQSADTLQALLEYSFQFKGIRYKLGGSTVKGFDCSGFAQYVFQNIGISLPRTSHAQSFVGKEIPLDSAKAGDLIFFGRKKNDSYFSTHTSIVVSNNNGVIRVIHAVRGGIKEENIFDYNYYRKRFLFVRRVSNI